jgi:hypothetical protein
MAIGAGKKPDSSYRIDGVNHKFGIAAATARQSTLSSTQNGSELPCVNADSSNNNSSGDSRDMGANSMWALIGGLAMWLLQNVSHVLL